MKLLIKIVLFILMMLFVAWTVPYSDLIFAFVSKHITLDESEKIAKFILGEPDPEPRESLRDYLSLLINTLISMPLLSAIITAYNTITRRNHFSEIPEEWASSTLRRFAKLFLFTFLFWALLRFLPYQAIFPADQTHADFTMAAATAFNLMITVFCYRFLTNNLYPLRR
ncbi:hypothetical protein M8013_11825 [Enterobacteriaceae bacterium H4N4]|uniref:Uncharacterized protein n=1 Tax=Silvania confinis TaxID=2926470 RepID=A0A9J6QJG1_9ENTR|nr:hypothetical protein [Silvania confinis]MCU6669434.1 hypothetical protein [Silvania confinis]